MDWSGGWGRIDRWKPAPPSQPLMVFRPDGVGGRGPVTSTFWEPEVGAPCQPLVGPTCLLFVRLENRLLSGLRRVRHHGSVCTRR